MHFSRLFFNLNAYLTLILALTAIIGDYLVKNSSIHLVVALFDNTTHTIIGGLCWVIFYFNSDKTGDSTLKGLLEILGCSLLSSVIDLDHFIAAKSVYFKDATSLKHRPFLHCSTIPLTLFIILILTSYVLQLPSLKRVALIVLTAFMSHHVRDATRRGLWFYPFGSTAPIPYLFYILLTCLVPYFVLLIDRLIKVEQIGESSSYSIMI